MLFSDNNTRYHYVKPPLIETISQVRFPTILAIGNDEPADFQEAIRADFPKYTARKEQQPPKVEDGKLVPQPSITNHTFVSADGVWKVNLTKDFIALSTLRYTSWEAFAQTLDKILVAFIQVYKPAFFLRIGLRYMNAISKDLLGVTDLLWDDLINSPFIGVLDQPDVDENTTAKSMLDVDTAFGEGRRLRLHCGPGILNNGKQKESKPRFILDSDLSLVREQIPCESIADELNTLHDCATRLFNAAATQELKNAMGPTPIE